MPDDEVTEVAELQDSEALDEFDSAADAEETGKEAEADKPPVEKEKPPDEKPPAKVDEKPLPDEKVADDKKGEKEPDKEEKSAEEALTAQQLADQAAVEAFPPAKEVPRAEQLPPDDTKGQPSDFTKERIAGYLATVSDDDLPDGEIIVGDETVDLKEFKAEWPDQWTAVKVMANVIAAKTVDKALADSGVNGTVIGELREEVRALRFWSDVSEVHPDARMTNKSKEFNEWIDKQSPSFQTLAKNLRTPNDAVVILNAYKDSIAAGKTKEHDDTQRDLKKKKDDLHKSSIRSKKEVPSATGDDDEVTDPEKEFALAAEEEEKAAGG